MTRQWLTNPNNMCISHILAEHAEAHMFVSKMRNGQSMDGFIEGHMFFGAEYVKARHDQLEIYLPNHDTSLEITEKMISDYPLLMPTMEDLKVSLATLLSRCDDCRNKHTHRQY